jgi:hypothetical protein
MSDEHRDASADDLVWRWHDNLIYGLSVDTGAPERQERRSNLIFDIDYICEWLREPLGEAKFRVAAATLTFHDVTDLVIAIDHGSSDGCNVITEWSIDRVDRERLDRPFDYWRWTIQLNLPSAGTIVFCATGFSQDLRTEPTLCIEQRLPCGAQRTSNLL